MKDIWKALQMTIEDNIVYLFWIGCILLLLLSAIIGGTRGFIVTFLIGGLSVICGAIVYGIIFAIKELYRQFKDNLILVKNSLNTETFIMHPEFQERNLNGEIRPCNRRKNDK